jgi:Co/Zn/Cd efflux system component
VYVTSDVLARVISGVVAAVLAAGMARWVIEANHRFFVPHPIRPVQFRVPQLLLAVAGLTAALVQVAYLTYFATTDRIWRRFRGVSITFAVLASAWTAAWLIDRYVLDAVFLD